ncbi:hypothetical protein BDA99DRAFT_242179 [Phascolomyces articulosus]|uniref:Uncharacterized protein n=1 Tax=Phascolomyces articulosus TaxID=60185 RepID=A0AAD5PI22_9FUNG|nr:hypothetical protein BDA99DRAFT_242179 [Phascolomyces articulosus]
MLQVSRLSNTMIDQILGDTETTLVMASATTTEDMVSIVRLYQDMLKEIGHLRTTLNDLQVEYVKKIQENGSRLEKEIMLRQQQQQTQQQQSSSVLVTWVSNMFQLSSSSPPSPPRPRPTLSASPLSSRHHQHPYHKQNHYQSLPNIISSSSSTLSSSSSSLSYRAKQQQQPPAIKPSISSSTTTTSSSSTSSTVTTTTTTSSSSRHHHQHRRQASLRMSQSTGTARSIPSSRSSYQQRGDDWAMSSVMDRRPSMMLPMDTNFRGSLSTSLLVGR